ncbi:5-formyltetrahydrofolate cyclo-ligase [Aureimonas sp. ME7]|uniref:5-formyltetrahydrofolate cyclo-ligase n=1 Tax=Aureimonas sp. ME7 TaxID=2744252 RepID=UPI0015F35676|nr:5-formyltetrahydrofolate cyclo-ligase [Aureimonas sp. ME7]
MPDIAILKAELRRVARARRDALPETWRAEASLAIVDGLKRCLPDGDLATVGAYLPIRSEIDPRPAMQWLWARGARLAVPAIVEGELDFRELAPGAALEPQGLGTVAPGPGAGRLDPAILLVPLLAFDARGARIGYGKGFYDRAIERLHALNPSLLTVGLAFEAQGVDEVPVDARDRFLDFVVTENGVRAPSASASPA